MENTTDILMGWRDRFPRTFGQVDEGSCFALFGLEINKGWYPIVEELAGKIEARLAEKEAMGLLDPDYPFSIFQIKEKYATLRVYVNSADDTIFKWIHEAEQKSKHTCEFCGAEGKVCGSTWIHTLCEPCRIQRNIEPFDKTAWGG